jgi:hypothetical protein
MALKRKRNGGVPDVLPAKFNVVPAKAGTHNPRR